MEGENPQALSENSSFDRSLRYKLAGIHFTFDRGDGIV